MAQRTSKTKKPGKIVIAQFDTPNFEFLAIGRSREECVELLAKAWKLHAVSQDADPNYFEEFKDDINFLETRWSATVFCDYATMIEEGDAL